MMTVTIFLQHRIRTTSTRKKSIPRYQGLIQTKQQIFYRIANHLPPIQVLHLFPDDKENLHQVVVSYRLQVNLLGYCVEQFDVRYSENIDIGVDGQFQHSWMWCVHDGLLETEGPAVAPGVRHS
jgi:hypothetical protein